MEKKEVDNYHKRIRKNNSLRSLRREWFGGFEYAWQNNFIKEHNTYSFEKILSLNSDNFTVFIKSRYPNYLPCPIRINIDLTYLCNKNCLYCHSNSGFLGPKSLKGELSVKKISKILRDCEKMGVFEVTLTGGEPLLKKGIFEILDCAGSLKSVFSNLITNGALITQQIAKRIKKSGVNKVCVSIDGFEKTMNKHRWKGSYIETMNALKLLLAVGVNVGVISVITKYNVKEFEQFIDTLYELGVRNHNTSALCDIGRARNNWLGLNYEQLVNFSRKMDFLKNKMRKKGYNLTFNNAVLSLGNKPESLPIYIFEDAVPGWKCIVKANGNVIYDRVWGSEFKLGSVKEQPLYKIWANSEKKRAKFIKDVYQEVTDKKMPQIYYRVDKTRLKCWDWQSALIRYYG